MLNDALDKHKAGDLAGAETIYKDALVEEPDNHEVLHLYALLKQDQGKLDEATAMLGRAIELRPEAASFHASMGGLLQISGDSAGALAALEKALSLNSNLVQAHIALGYLHMAEGRLSDARTRFETALKMEPESLPATLNMANLFILEGNPDKAVAFAQQAVDMQPRQPVAQTTLGRAFAAQGHPAFAEQCFRNALKEREDYVTAKIELARVLGDTNQIDEALTVLQDILSQDRDNVPALDALGDIAFRQKGYSQAAQNYQFALTLDRSRADILAKLGQAYLAMGDSSNALLCLDNALSRGFDSTAVHAARGDALAAGNQLQEALTAYEPALSVKPMDVTAWTGYSRVMVTTQQGYTAAERLSEALAATQASSGPLTALLGRLCLTTGRPAEAAEFLSRAAQHEDTKVGETSALLGRAHHVLEQYEQAAAEFLAAADAEDRTHIALESNQRIADLKAPTVEDDHDNPVFLMGTSESGLRTWISRLRDDESVRVLSDRTLKQMDRQDFLAQPEAFLSLQEVPEATVRLQRRRYWRSVERAVGQSGVRTIDAVPLSLDRIQLISKIFPAARVVLLLRDPRDLALQALANGYPEPQARQLALDHQQVRELIAGSGLNWACAALPESVRISPERDFLATLLGINADLLGTAAAETQSWQPVEMLEDESWTKYEPYLKTLFSGLNKVGD